MIFYSRHACIYFVLLTFWIVFKVLVYAMLLPNQVLVFIPASRLPLFALRDVAVWSVWWTECYIPNVDPDVECQRRWWLMRMDCICIGIIWTVLSAFALLRDRSDWSRRQRGAIRFTLPTASVASAWCDVPNVEALMDCVGIWTVRYLHCLHRFAFLHDRSR